jgi:hypothetical protein
MPSSPARRWRAAGLVTTFVVLVGLAVLAAQAATPGRAISNPRPRVALSSARSATVVAVPMVHQFVTPALAGRTAPASTPASTASSSPTSTNTTAPAAPTTTTTAPATPPPQQTSAAAAPAVGAPAVVPSVGQATVWGCAAALAYLAAHAYPGFTFECPGYALGHQGMTCKDWPGVCPGQLVIAIADPCPAAYMNEASNSWVLMGASTAPEDPYGAC